MRPLLALMLAIVLCGLSTSVAIADPGAALVITGYDGHQLAEVTLTCHPAGGTHPDARGACATLDAVGGDLTALEPFGGICPTLYRPVTVRVGGRWRTRIVEFERTYPNQCVAFDASHGVFRF